MSWLSIAKASYAAGQKSFAESCLNQFSHNAEMLEALCLIVETTVDHDSSFQSEASAIDVEDLTKEAWNRVESGAFVLSATNDVWRAIEDQDLHTALKLSKKLAQTNPNDDTVELHLLVVRLAGKSSDGGLGLAKKWMHASSFSERSVCNYLLIAEDVDPEFIDKVAAGGFGDQLGAARIAKASKEYTRSDDISEVLREGIESENYVKNLALKTFCQHLNNREEYKYEEQKTIEEISKNFAIDYNASPIEYENRSLLIFIIIMFSGINDVPTKWMSFAKNLTSYSDASIRVRMILKTETDLTLRNEKNIDFFAGLQKEIEVWKKLSQSKMSTEEFLLSKGSVIFSEYVLVASWANRFSISDGLIDMLGDLRNCPHHVLGALGSAALQSKNYQLAEKIFNQSMIVRPTCLSCGLGLAQTKRKLNDPLSALSILGPLFQSLVAPIFDEDMKMRKEYDESGRVSAEHHNKVERFNSNFLPTLTHELGKIYIELSEWDQARKYLRAANKFSPLDRGILENIERVCIRLGDEEGQKFASEALSALTLKRRGRSEKFKLGENAVTSTADIKNIVAGLLL